MTPIKGFPGYFINEQGEIFLLKKISSFLGNHGYWMAHMVDEFGKNKCKTVHRLMAKTFLENPENKPEVAHNDGNRANCSLKNLRWATRAENKKDEIAHGTRIAGEKHSGAKLSKDQVLEIREYYKNKKFNGRQLAKMYNTSYKNISSIVLRNTWKHV